MDESSQPEKRPDRRADADTQGWYRMAGAGFEFIVAVMLFAGIGWLLDGWLKTLPWLTVAGAGLGFAVGLYMLVRMAGRMFKD